MGYFLAIYICLYLYSFMRYGKLTATQLYDTSYQSKLHVRNSAVTSGGVEILCDLLLKNGLVQSNMKLQDELMVAKQNAKAKYTEQPMKRVSTRRDTASTCSSSGFC